jgi:hypothetical protein
MDQQERDVAARQKSCGRVEYGVGCGRSDAKDGMSEKFISEALAPGTATFDTARMAAGEPGLPREFIWHGTVLRIASVQREWRETGTCRHGSGEQYVRKHWYQVEDDQGRVLKIYFARSAIGRPAKAAKACWQLFSMV